MYIFETMSGDKYNTTFVSAFISIYDSSHVETHPEKTLEKRISHFEDMAKTGIPLCLYTCETTKHSLSIIVEKYPNVKMMEYDYRSSASYTLCMDPSLGYPSIRSNEKDTREYMALMHCKIEFMNDAILHNPWNTNTFAWIDFSIGYIYRNREDSLNRLVQISKKSCPEHMLAIPGCWEKIKEESVILQKVHWRFCGGFFIGHTKMLTQFHTLYQTYLPIFLHNYKTTVWEVNFWAWLELHSSWKPLWYLADHNDSIIRVPSNIWVEGEQE